LAFAAGLGLGLGDAITVVLALALALEFSAVLQPIQKMGKASESKKLRDRLIEVPPLEQISNFRSSSGKSIIYER
jgi:hypothetical protein